jgi:hypothetical protein
MFSKNYPTFQIQRNRIMFLKRKICSMTKGHALISLMILTSLGMFIGQGPSLAQRIQGKVDANKAYQQLGASLGTLGMVGTGVTKDTPDAWCVFNDWRARDQMKTKYKGGNLNFKTTFGGTWFCVMKS